MAELASVLQQLSISGGSLAEVRIQIDEVAPKLQGVHIGPVLESFASLTTSLDLEATAQANRILGLLLERIGTPELLSAYAAFLADCLRGSARLAPAVLKEISQRAKANPDEVVAGLGSGQGEQLTAAVSAAIGTVNRPAIDLLLLLSKLNLQTTLGSAVVREALNGLLEELSTARFRLHEFVSEGAVADPAFLAAAAEHGYLASLVGELDGTDILCQLSCLELLASMAAGAPHAAEWLKKAALTPKLHAMLATARESPEGGFLFPALIRFFGYLAAGSAETLDTYPLFMASLWQMVGAATELEPAQRLLALDTLGLIGSSREGRDALAKREPELRRALGAFGRALRSGPSPIRARHYEALRELLKPLEGQTADESDRLCSWWGWTTSTENVVATFRQMVPELHKATGGLIAAVLAYPWAQAEFVAVPGFVEYVLNREFEFEMEGRYAKYAIVQSLIAHQNPEFPSLEGPTLMRFKEFEQQGPYFVVAPTEVATESAE